MSNQKIKTIFDLGKNMQIDFPSLFQLSDDFDAGFLKTATGMTAMKNEAIRARSGSPKTLVPHPKNRSWLFTHRQPFSYGMVISGLNVALAISPAIDTLWSGEPQWSWFDGINGEYSTIIVTLYPGGFTVQVCGDQ